MRSLTLLRHAKSSWDDDSLDDFDRPLNERGRKAAKAMGRHLAKAGARFDLILASPAQRVVETIEALKAGGWKDGPVRFDRAIYDSSSHDLVELVRSTPANIERLMLVGHNPAMGTLAMQLTEDDEKGLRASVSQKYPTGALAEIELDVDRWVQVGPQCGRFVEFTAPRSLGGT